MKHSIFNKFFAIIFIAFLLFQSMNFIVDYKSTIEYRIQLLDDSRDESGTENFVMEMSEHEYALNEMKWAFQNSYKNNGYDMHFLVKCNRLGTYEIVKRAVETDGQEPVIVFRVIEKVIETQDDLSVEYFIQRDVSYSLKNFNQVLLDDLRKIIENPSQAGLFVSFKVDEKENLKAISINGKEYYANNVKLDEMLVKDWDSGTVVGITTSDMQYTDSIIDYTYTTIYFDEYEDACAKQLSKLIPSPITGNNYELKKDGYFKYKDGIIVYDISFVGSEIDFEKVTFNQDITPLFEDEYHDNPLIWVNDDEQANYFVYDFYYIDTTTLAKDVSYELIKTKAGVYFGMTMLAVLVSFILSKMLTKNIQAMMNVTTKISKNDFSEKLPVRTHDEIGVLSENINTMSDQLNKTIEALNEEIVAVKYLEGVRKEFIANFTHEIKTPIAIINGYIELMSQTEDELKKQEYLGAINKETNRMTNLVMSMLELTKLESGKKELKMKEISLEDCLPEIIDSYLPLIKKNKIQLRLAIEDEVFEGDSIEIEKVIRNFLSNAIKHTKEGGYITIQFKNRCFSIENEGNPISDEDMKLIFETYVSKSREGTGLGLAICKAILELHHFSYGVENTEKGVKFHFEV